MWLAHTSANCDGSSSNTFFSASSARVEPATEARRAKICAFCSTSESWNDFGNAWNASRPNWVSTSSRAAASIRGVTFVAAGRVLLAGDENDDLALQRLPGEVRRDGVAAVARHCRLAGRRDPRDEGRVAGELLQCVVEGGSIKGVAVDGGGARVRRSSRRNRRAHCSGDSGSQANDLEPRMHGGRAYRWPYGCSPSGGRSSRRKSTMIDGKVALLRHAQLHLAEVGLVHAVASEATEPDLLARLQLSGVNRTIPRATPTSRMPSRWHSARSRATSSSASAGGGTRAVPVVPLGADVVDLGLGRDRGEPAVGLEPQLLRGRRSRRAGARRAAGRA